MTRAVDELPFRSVLAVCAHPDDESFGLGGVLSALTGAGMHARVLCFTRGEASTLGGDVAHLGVVRAAELAAGAAVLGIEAVRLLDYPDGRLAEVPVDSLARDIEDFLDGSCTECLVVFDLGGITGHPDHARATEAALETGRRMAMRVLAWAIPNAVASALNREFDMDFVGRDPSEVDIQLTVDRERQLQAIACHASQAMDNMVLWRRLELLGDTESLRWLGQSPTASVTGPAID